MESIATGSRTSDWEVSRMALFGVLKQSKPKDQFADLLKYLQNQTNCPKSELSKLKIICAKFKAEYSRRWSKCNRKSDRFITQNKTWLHGNIKFKKNDDTLPTRRGRPESSFDNSSERTKRRKVAALRNRYSGKELTYASQMSLRASGQVDAAKVVRDVSFTTPRRATKYRNAYKRSEEPVEGHISRDEALSMMVDAKLTRHQYNVIRSKDKKKFPCYSYIQDAKKDCYPDKESISIDSTSAEVKLQTLLNHTLTRLVKVQEEVLNTLDMASLRNLTLISKWGIDGTSTSEYKQKFDSDEDTDSSIFLTSFVPLQLLSESSTQGNPKILWQNPRPSSTRYCRPIKFVFQRESVDITVAEKQRVEDEIKTLKPTEIEIKGHKCEVKHKLLFTMIDGKVCNAVTGTKYTQRCYICGLTSKDFNNLEKCTSMPVNEEFLEFGLSILHGWIRFMETLLHISYKLPLKKWAVTKNENHIIETRKKSLQKKFKDELGLLIDKPKQGFGNSNDGNMARRFFENSSISAQITEIDEDLIVRFHTVLQTISCGFQIDNENFQSYCLETAKKYIEQYNWYRMPTTVHKILVHGPVVVSKALLPIGQLSEEAQEARNKDFKRFREGYSRKTSRAKTNEDVFNNLLISSDPFISSFRQLPPRKFRKLPEQVIRLLEVPAGPHHAERESASEPDSPHSSDSE